MWAQCRFEAAVEHTYVRPKNSSSKKRRRRRRRHKEERKEEAKKQDGVEVVCPIAVVL